MLHVILYRPELASNTGNVMRTCAAIGAKLHIVGPFSFSLFGKEVARAAMDYGPCWMFRYMTIFHRSNTQTTIRHLDDFSVRVIVYSEVDFRDESPIYVMFGSESSGIPLDILRENHSKTLRLPMVPSARSLNLSNSVAVIVYEIMRQRDMKTFRALKY
jgi:tRNA (cytidine/uridine-2'-O-)-methyltransferase